MKQRSVFALRNFRGLDKENKLLKVQPFRATDGYNFFIDSETLKTRPSFLPKINPPFFQSSSESIIDWYKFGEIFIYITNLRIRIIHNNVSLTQSSTSSNYIGSAFQNTLSLLDTTPLFQEEKECLFIFCARQIYVFSTIKNQDNSINKYVLYWLNQKPTNPYSEVQENFLWKQFQDLPEPYVPTLFLGNNAFEDVNLLSTKSKYKLFANVPTTKGYNVYNLPTYYDEEKHGTFSTDDIKVEFYQNQFKGFEALPVYMGVYDEDWFGTITTDNGVSTMGTYGTWANQGDDILIDDIYFAPKPFDYLGYKENQNQIDVIDERIYLDRQTFFNLNIGTQTVFEYLMNYIETENITANIVLSFTLRVQFEAIYRDSSYNIHDRKTQQDEKTIYVQLKRFETGTVTRNNVAITQNIDITSDLNDAYPSYPDIPETNDYEATLTTTPIIIANNINFEERLTSLAKTHIEENLQSITSGDTIYIKAQLYKQTTSIEEREPVLPLPEEDIFEFVVNVDQTQPVYSTYPDIPNPTNLLVKDLGIYGKVDSETRNLTFNQFSQERFIFENEINNWIQSTEGQTYIDSPSNADVDYIIFRIKMYVEDYLPDPEDGVVKLFYFAHSVTAKVFLTPRIVETQERRSMVYKATILYNQIPINIDDGEGVLYTINLKDDKTTIELSIKDYFFDYKNEPTFEVTVEFSRNTEYEYISRSSFGITFGSENRLFLTGNSNFPNIDRYNVSNDLLGDNVKNQSYELTYFPSKNYRVLGGKGAINGYVVATDSVMYVTKENYPNDSKLFIRQRNVSEQGIVSYFESKTNITKTPINHRCIVRFYNDILILAKDGLYGIELSQNVLTDERLVKLRSGFINKDLVEAIDSFYDIRKIFILENNVYMYIFIGSRCYVADSRYVGQASNSSIENISYEIIEWKIPIFFVNGKVFDEEIYLVERINGMVYGLDNYNNDRDAFKDDNAIFSVDSPINSIYKSMQISTPPSLFSFSSSRLSDYVVTLTQGYQLIAINPNDYTRNNSLVTITNNSTAFSSFTTGDTLYWKEINGNTYYPFTISNFESSNFVSFGVSSLPQNADFSKIYHNIANKELYLTRTYDRVINNVTVKFFQFSHKKPDEVIVYGQSTPTLVETENIYDISNDLYVELRTPINMRWVSAITDFGNSQMEKTSFRLNIYATKQDETNLVTFGYRTMRRLAGFNEVIDLSNNFNLEEVEFNQFSLATFNTNALSRPMKENNFLYIQFTLDGTGSIEINAIEVLYKVNRMLKSIG